MTPPHPPSHDPEPQLAVIAAELRRIRWILTIFLIAGLALAGWLISPGAVMALAIVGGALWLVAQLMESAYQRSRRRQEEAFRFRQLSGRQDPG